MTRPPSPLAQYDCSICEHPGVYVNYIFCTESDDYYGCPDCQCEDLEWGFMCERCLRIWGINVKTGATGTERQFVVRKNFEQWVENKRP